MVRVVIGQPTDARAVVEKDLVIRSVISPPDHLAAIIDLGIVIVIIVIGELNGVRAVIEEDIVIRSIPSLPYHLATSMFQ